MPAAPVGKRCWNGFTVVRFRPVPLRECIETSGTSRLKWRQTPGLRLLSGSGHCAGISTLSFETDLAARKRRRLTTLGRYDRRNWTRTNNRRAETTSSGIPPKPFWQLLPQSDVPKPRSRFRLLIRRSLPSVFARIKPHQLIELFLRQFSGLRSLRLSLPGSQSVQCPLTNPAIGNTSQEITLE